MADSDEQDDDGEVGGESTVAELAECGACRAQIPVDSASCPECGISFSGVTSEELGECGSCGKLVPIDSSSCPECGVNFILDDLVAALREWLEQKSITVTILFNEVDADGDGVLTADEVKQALSSRNLSFLGTDELDRFLMQIDLDRDGTISFGELAAALMIPMGINVDEEEPAEAEAEVGAVEATDEPEETAAPSVGDYSFSDDVLSKILKKHDISDRDAFLEHAMAFDEDGNLYLKKSELEKAAKAFEAPEEADDKTLGEADGETDDAEAEEDEAAEEPDEDEDEAEDDTEDDGEAEGDTEDDEEAEDDAEDDEEAEDDAEDDEEEVEEVDTDPSKLQIWLMRNEENVFPIGWAALGLALVAVLINIYGFFSSLFKCNEGENAWLLSQDYCADNEKLNLLDFWRPGNPISWSETGSWGIPDIFALLLVIGLLGGSLYLRFRVTAWKAQYRKKKDGEDEEEVDDADEEQDDDSDEDADEAEADQDSDDGDDDDEDDDEAEDEDEDDDDGEDEIDVGSKVGVEHDGKEFSGTIVEFDDEEDEVLVRRDDDDEEVWVPFDSLFLE